MKKASIFLLSAMFLVGCASNYGTPSSYTPAKPMMVPPPMAPASGPVTVPQVPAEPSPVSAGQEAKASTFVNTYSSKDFSFEYPKDLTVKTDVTLAAGKGLQLNGLEKYSPKTNLTAADIEITSGGTVASCEGNTFFGPSLAYSVSKTFNGAEFQFDTYQDAGAGQRQDSTVYSTVHNNKCYMIALVTQYSVLENYETPPPAFDKQKIEAVLTDLMNSFKFKN